MHVILFIFVPGGCAIAPSALVGKDLIDSSYDFPWALLLTGIGGIISTITMFLTIVLSCQTSTQRRQIQPDNTDNTVAMQQAGIYQNPGYSAPLTTYAQPENVVGAYGGANGGHIYPSLSAPTEKQYSTPSAPPFA